LKAVGRNKIGGKANGISQISFWKQREGTYAKRNREPDERNTAKDTEKYRHEWAVDVKTTGIITREHNILI
jgi:hypothetical protein